VNGWRKHNWTPEGDEKLIELWNSDRDLPEVASLLGMTRDLVVRRASHLRVHHKRPLRSRAKVAAARPGRETESVPCRCGGAVSRYKGSTRSLCDVCRTAAQSKKGHLVDGMPPAQVALFMDLVTTLETAAPWQREQIKQQMRSLQARAM
jgi:hypothetical protein